MLLLFRSIVFVAYDSSEMASLPPHVFFDNLSVSFFSPTGTPARGFVRRFVSNALGFSYLFADEDKGALLATFSSPPPFQSHEMADKAPDCAERLCPARLFSHLLIPLTILLAMYSAYGALSHVFIYVLVGGFAQATPAGKTSSFARRESPRKSTISSGLRPNVMGAWTTVLFSTFLAPSPKNLGPD